MYPKNYNVHSFVSEAGERYAPRYIGEVMDDGKILLNEVDKTDLWQMHSAQADSCDINNIVARFQNGDIYALNKVQGSYVDVSGMPTDLKGMYDLVNGINYWYDHLDDKIKAQFDGFDSFLEAAGSEEWFAKLNNFDKDSEVEVNEQK